MKGMYNMHVLKYFNSASKDLLHPAEAALTGPGESARAPPYVRGSESWESKEAIHP